MHARVTLDAAGWGVLLQYKEFKREISGSDPATTNNRMELLAVINGLGALKRPCRVKLHSDSRYVVDGVTRWMPNWKMRGWRTASNTPIKNCDLWQMLDALLETSGHHIDWVWVKGHSDDPGNNRADTLARDAVPPEQSKSKSLVVCKTKKTQHTSNSNTKVHTGMQKSSYNKPVGRHKYGHTFNDKHNWY